MTTERWTDEMLDRLVGSISNLAGLSEQNTREISTLGESIKRLASIAEAHQQSLEVHQQSLDRHQQSLDRQQENFNAVIGEIREMQAEVKGLQTENRRILDQLINRNGDQP